MAKKPIEFTGEASGDGACFIWRNVETTDERLKPFVEDGCLYPNALLYASGWDVDNPDYGKRHRIAVTIESLPTLCWLCKKPITGKVYFQGGQRSRPAHRDCRVAILTRRGGGV